jgi:cell division protein FtsZ
MNLDFEDVTTVLKDGGVAIMSTGYGEGEGRVTKALTEALTSPLLNHNDIFNSKKVLLNINFCADDDHSSLMMEEMNEIHEFMGKFRHDVETKWGLATDSTLGNKVKITLLATGFGLQSINGMSTHLEERKEKLSAEDKERKENRDELINIYYQDGKKSAKHRHNNVFIYTAENMDNDDIISRVDATPTCRRSKDELNRLKNENAG